MKLSFALIIIALTLSFFQGVANLMGLPSLEYQLLIDLSVYLLLFNALFKKSRFRAPFLSLFLSLTIIFLSSGIINSSEFFTGFRMYRNTLIPFLFFIAVVNLPLKERHFIKVNSFLFVLIFIQIIAAVIKYLAWGIREGGIIGTFSASAGQMSTIFPLLTIIFLMVLYLIYDKNNLYLFMLIGFIFMSWGGGKRAIVFILPVFLLFTYLNFRKFEFESQILTLKNSLKLSPLILLAVPLFYTMVILSPTLNPENEVGGSFNMDHLIEYSTGYHFGTSTRLYGAQRVELGRVTTTKIALDHITKSPAKFLFGYGPSSVYATTRGDEELVQFGVVSFQTGFSNYIMSIGVLGAILLILLYYKMSSYSLKNYNSYSPYWRALTLGVYLSFFVLLFDFFIYSAAFVHELIPSMVIFYLAGAVSNISNQKKNIENFIHT